MKNLYVKICISWLLSLIIIVYGIINILPTYALTSIPILTISESLINLINDKKVSFPIVHKYCPITIPTSWDTEIWVKKTLNIYCTQSYYRKLALTTHKTIIRTLRSYERRYPDIKQRIEKLKTSIDYAEMQRDDTINKKKKFVYDFLRLEFRNYVANLNDKDNICSRV